MQHSVPSLAQVVQRVESGFAKNPDPHVTCEWDPSLFVHVLAARYLCVNILRVLLLRVEGTVNKCIKNGQQEPL